MKNHLTERVISAIWLAILGYLFVYSSSFLSPESKSNLFMFFSIVVPIFYFLFGYFHSYKILLLPADYLNTFPLRCVSGVLLGSLSYFIIMGIYSLIFDKYAQANLAVLIGFGAFSFLIGWIFLYRVLLFPKVIYLKLFPSFIQRVISAIWFGIIGYLLAVIIIRQATGELSIFVLLLASYLGFAYGYRILLLPTSIKGIIKSIMIGLIGNSYALLIIFLLFISSELPKLLIFSPNNHIGDIFGTSFVWIFVIFPLVSLFICGIGVIFSLIFYLISRPLTYISKN